MAEAGPWPAADSPAAAPLSSRRALAWAVALSVLVPALFFLPALSPARQFGYFDNGRMHLPMKRFIADELGTGRFPAWNPYSGLGAPVAAGGVDAVQHPFNLLLVALPFDLGFKLWVLLCFPIAALGARALALRLGAGAAAATVVGLAFALSGYPVSMTGNMQYLGALAFFPWILATGLAFAEAPGPGRAALVGLASGLCAASGDPQGWAIAVGLVPVAAAAFPAAGVPGRRAASRALGAVLAAAAGALPFVLPVAAWIPHSGRSEPFDAYEYSMFNLLPPRAAELVLPGLFHADGRGFAYRIFEAYAGDRFTPLPWALSEYLGAAVAALAVVGAVRHRVPRLLLAAAAAFTWMAMGSYAGFGQLARHLPILSTFRYWEKLAAWPALLVALAAAFGLEEIVARRLDVRRAGAALLAAGAALSGLGGLASLAPGPVARLLPPPGPPATAALEVAGNLATGLLLAGLAIALLGLLALAHAARRLPAPAVAIGALCLLDLGAANVGAYRLSAVESTRPPSRLAATLRARDPAPRLLTPFGLSLEGARYTLDMEASSRLAAQALYAAWNVPERVGNLQVWSGMLPVRFNRYWRRMGRKDHLPGVGLWGFRWLWVPDELGDNARRLLPQGVSATPEPDLPGRLFELPARPRAYLAQALEAVDRRAAMEFVLDPTQAATDRSVLEAAVPAGYTPPRGEASVSLEAPSRVEVTATTDRPALLVLNDVFTVGWRATVDGVGAEILPVNYLARGVWIPAGAHRVAFSYRTPWLAEAWALLGIAGIGTWLWSRRRSRRRAREAPARPSAQPGSGGDPATASPGAAWRAAALYAGSLALFYAPALLGLGEFVYRDDGRMHGPHKRLIAEAWSRGEVPGWNPYGGLGVPLVAGAVDAPLHPFNLFFALWPSGPAITAWVLASALLGAVGMRAWARRLGVGEAPALAAGFALALGGFLVSSTDNLTYLTALATLPLLLAAAHAFIARGGPARAAALAAASALAAAAGDPQSWGTVAGLLPLYAALLVPAEAGRRRDLVWRGVAAVPLALAGAAPFLLPVLGWIGESSRGDPLQWIERVRYSLLPVRLLELGVPGLLGGEPERAPSALYQALAGDRVTPLPWVISEYAGATVLALAALGAARGRRAALLLAGALAFLWAALGPAAGFAQLAAKLPVLQGFRYWEKVTFFAALLAVAAAALGAQEWLGAPGRTRTFDRGVGATAALALLGAGALHLAPRLLLGLGGQLAPTLARNLAAGLLHTGTALAGLAVLGLLGRRAILAPAARGAALVTLVAVDLAAASASAYVLSPAGSTRPPSAFALRLAAQPGQHRVVSPFPIYAAGDSRLRPFEWEARHGASTLHSGWNVDYRIGNFEPYTGMIPARLMRFRSRTGWMHQHPQVGLWGVDLAVVPLDDPDPGRMNLGPPHDVVARDDENDAMLVRIPHRPRAYLASEVASVDRRGAMEFVLDPASVASARTVVEGPVPPGLPPPQGEVALWSDDRERVELGVRTDRRALLVLNDMLASGWSAEVDGAPAGIVPTNYLVRGVWLEPGSHRVTFRYRTPLLAEGWLVALALVAGLTAWAAAARRRPAAGSGPTGA